MTHARPARSLTSSAAQVARCHLLERRFLLLPWAIFALVFVINLIIAALTPGDPHRVGGVVAMFIVMFALGVLSAARLLPFVMMLGASRRAYVCGAVGFAAAVSIVDGLILAVLQATERASDGWGVTGLLAFIGGQLLAPLIASGVTTATHGWASVDRWFGGVQGPGTAGLLAGMLVLTLAAGWTTARRVAV